MHRQRHRLGGVLRRILPFCLVAMSGLVVHSLQVGHDAFRTSQDGTLSEMMYFPSGTLLKSFLCDYDMLAADAVWLRTIQYYGQHTLSDLKYQWLAHIFQILTDFDPHFIRGYRLGGLLISEDAGQPQAAIEILQKGMRSNPENYEIPFDMAFIHFIVTKDYRRAARYFWLAYVHEGIMGRGIRFCATMLRREGRRQAAKNVWRMIMTQAPDSARRRTAWRSLNYMQIEEDMVMLRNSALVFRRQQGGWPASLSELVSHRLIAAVPAEPFGGYYDIKRDGTILNSTEQYDVLEMTITHLNQRLTAYRSARGRFPDNLGDLVTAGLLDRIPEHPFGHRFIYDRTQGKVILPAYAALVSRHRP